MLIVIIVMITGGYVLVHKNELRLNLAFSLAPSAVVLMHMHARVLFILI